MSQRDMSRIARAAQALRELTMDDLLIVRREAAACVMEAAGVLAAIPAHDWTREAHPDVIALMRAGKKIQAVKLQRELTSMDLVDAKNFVEGIAL